MIQKWDIYVEGKKKYSQYMNQLNKKFPPPFFSRHLAVLICIVYIPQIDFISWWEHRKRIHFPQLAAVLTHARHRLSVTAITESASNWRPLPNTILKATINMTQGVDARGAEIGSEFILALR